MGRGSKQRVSLTEKRQMVGNYLGTGEKQKVCDFDSLRME